MNDEQWSGRVAWPTITLTDDGLVLDWPEGAPEVALITREGLANIVDQFNVVKRAIRQASA